MTLEERTMLVQGWSDATLSLVALEFLVAELEANGTLGKPEIARFLARLEAFMLDGAPPHVVPPLRARLGKMKERLSAASRST